MGILPNIVAPTAFVPVEPAEARWYALHTRSRHEKIVASLLEEKGIASFLPLIASRRRWSDRNKTIALPLFPGYTFVRLTGAPEKRKAVLYTPGVVGLVGHGGGTPIPDKEIEDVQLVLQQELYCQPYPFLRVGQKVRIRGGCLDGVEGILVAREGSAALVVSVDLIQRSVAVRLKGYEVEPVANA